jgi:REP element-mobilizing transposase RayT
LNKENAESLLGTLNFIRESDRAYVLAFAILPDHVHLLLVPKEGFSISDAMKSIKNHVATIVNPRSGSRGPLWQKSFYDRAIRNEAHLRTTIDYIHCNPVFASLVQEPGEYPFCSAYPGNECDIETFLGG